MTPEFNQNFLKNKSTIASFAGLEPLEDNCFVVHVEIGRCEVCHNEVPEKELLRDGGICGNCIKKGE